MDFKQVQYFIAVAQNGSFSAAAEDLFLSQSSISKQIMALEHELQVQLFDRSKRKIALTPAGQAFLPYAIQIAADCQAAFEVLRGFRVEKAGLAIVAIPVIAQYGISNYIAQFKQRYPEVQITLEEREAVEILGLLNNHQFQLAFMRDNYLDRASYDCLKVCQDQLVAVVSVHHPLANRSSVALIELADENFILMDKGTVVHELAVDACQLAGFQPRIFYASLRIESIISLVASKIGVALMMKQIVDYHARPDVITIPLHEDVTSNIVLAYPKNRRLPETARAFIGMLEQRLTPA